MLGYVLLVVLGSALFTVLFTFFTSDTLSVAYDHSRLTIGTTPRILISRFLGANWVYVMVTGGIVALVSLFLSHRIAGPLYRLERVIEHMIRGRIGERITLRQHDEGKDLAEKINRLNQTLAEKIEDIRIQVESLESALTKCGTPIKSEDLRHVRAICRSLRVAVSVFDIR